MRFSRRALCALGVMAASTAETISSRHVFQHVWPGVWQLSRRIVSPSQPDVFAEGYASFRPSIDDPNTLLYSEKVSLAGGGEGTQRYSYRLEDGQLAKYFQDGRLFYQLSTENGQICAVPHLCIADLYVPEYTFESDLSFRLKYVVSGPAKQYSIISHFTKAATSDHSLAVSSDE